MRNRLRPALALWVCVGLTAPAAPAVAEVTWEVWQSQCGGAGETREDRFEVDVTGGILRVRHLDVVTNCCLEYRAKVEVDGSLIRIHEVDAGPPCDCLCPFDLEVAVDGLEAGPYTVEVEAFLHRDPVTFRVEIPPREGYWLTAEEVWATLGTSGVEILVRATSERPIDAFSFGTRFPYPMATLTEVRFDGTVTEEAEPDFLEVEIWTPEEDEGDEGWMACRAVVQLTEPVHPDTIPAGIGMPLAILVYDLYPPAPGGSVPRSISVPLVGDVGDPPVGIGLRVEGEEVRVETRDGIIQTSPPATFLRGDADDDQEVNLTDAVFCLGYLFQGGKTPPCLDAADSNDDGRVDIADPVTTLSFLFLGGPIPPPVPTEPPGWDPTPDRVGCERSL